MDKKVMDLRFNYGTGCPGTCLHGGSVWFMDMDSKKLNENLEFKKLTTEQLEELQELVLEKLKSYGVI